MKKEKASRRKDVPQFVRKKDPPHAPVQPDRAEADVGPETPARPDIYIPRPASIKVYGENSDKRKQTAAGVLLGLYLLAGAGVFFLYFALTSFEQAARIVCGAVAGVLWAIALSVAVRRRRDLARLLRRKDRSLSQNGSVTKGTITACDKQVRRAFTGRDRKSYFLCSYDLAYTFTDEHDRVRSGRLKQSYHHQLDPGFYEGKKVNVLFDAQRSELIKSFSVRRSLRGLALPSDLPEEELQGKPAPNGRLCTEVLASGYLAFGCIGLVTALLFASSVPIAVVSEKDTLFPAVFFAFMSLPVVVVGSWFGLGQLIRCVKRTRRAKRILAEEKLAYGLLVNDGNETLTYYFLDGQRLRLGTTDERFYKMKYVRFETSAFAMPLKDKENVPYQRVIVAYTDFESVIVFEKPRKKAKGARP